MQILLNEIKNICLKYELTSLQRLIVSAENLLSEKFIDIAIFGQFKAGKSSFINSIIGKPILPTGVIPATSVITRIYFGEKERALLKFNDNRIEEICLNVIDEYITEPKNPKNIKGVCFANIEIPELKQYKGLCFIDTPGIGSIFLKNTQTTEVWSDEATIAIVCISAERPLSEFDLKLIKELDSNSYKLVCLLTKTDLFTIEQLEEINIFLQTSLNNEIGKNIEIYNYSILSNTNFYKNKISESICKPLLERYDNEIEKIYQHKVLKIATNCLNYIEIAHQASLKTDDEKKLLKEKIFDEKVNTVFIQQELRLITADSKSRVRDTVYNIFDKYSKNLLSELRNDLNNEFPLWKGNLYQLTRKYENWLKSALTLKLKNIADKEQLQFNEILNKINAHFSFYTKSLREKLSKNIFKVLEIKLRSDEWKPEFKPLKQPDISIYRTFDSNIDLLWFLFPMFIFRNIFKNYFSKQIAHEVEKNIHRLTSNITDIINKETNNNKEQTLIYILNELNTIEKVLSGKKSNSNDYSKTINELKQIIL
ncbi:MAG: hypothetical protein COS14_02450 [Bacteroidetes bacterium CG02_land_8_20_14_3_00_31_25]|nr:MAG: hypothetical protein COS14_02450 [Bacteroidetes bacterium CG02_land_8_20_14_3_00_31_25]